MSNTHFKNLSVNIHNHRLFENPRTDELVDILVMELPSFPANGNPFHYDHMSMGSSINKTTTMMMSSQDKDQHGNQYLYQGKTGQRHALHYVSKQPRPVKLMHITRHDLPKFMSGRFYTIETRELQKAGKEPNSCYIESYRQYEPGSCSESLQLMLSFYNPIDARTTPVYWVYGCTAILYYPGVENDAEALGKYVGRDLVFEADIVIALKALQENLAEHGGLDPL